MDPAAEMTQVNRMPYKTSPTPVSPARALSLANIYEARKDKPLGFLHAIETVHMNSVQYSHNVADGRVVYERLSRNVRVTPVLLNSLREDKNMGGTSRRAYATTYFPTTDRTGATLPRLLLREDIDSPGFRTRWDRMSRNPAQTHLHPERGDLVRMRKLQEKRVTGTYGEQFLMYMRMVLVAELKEKEGFKCMVCTRTARCKPCQDKLARLKTLTESQQMRLAPLEIEQEAFQVVDREESEDMSGSSKSLSSSVSSTEDGECSDLDGFVLVEVERAQEQERERRREVLRKAAERESEDLRRLARERDMDAMRQRTRYAQILVRGAAAGRRVSDIMASSKWW
jgi:hypothetical protein